MPQLLDLGASGDQEPGDEAATFEASTNKPADAAEAGNAPLGRKADEVLVEHHQLIRRLFETVEATSPHDPQRRDLMRTLASELEIDKTAADAAFEKAEVTTGGIALDEVDSRSMQSKLVPGLFLAGEVLDLDGPIGGYNFQAAWSTGWLAGRSAAGT